MSRMVGVKGKAKTCMLGTSSSNQVDSFNNFTIVVYNVANRSGHGCTAVYTIL